jgi:hypothetical protein
MIKNVRERKGLHINGAILDDIVENCFVCPTCYQLRSEGKKQELDSLPFLIVGGGG